MKNRLKQTRLLSMAAIFPLIAILAPAAHADPDPSSGRAYADYVQSTKSDEAAMPGAGRPTQLPEASQAARPLLDSSRPSPAAASDASIPRRTLGPGEIVSPKLVPPGSQRDKADAPALQVMAGDGWSHNYCSYYPNASANPAGPASGQSWAVGKAYRSFGWEIATSSRDGFDAESTTQSATSTSSLPIYLGPSWPTPSRIEGWAEPKLSGTFALNAAVSGFGVASGSNGRFTQDIGWTVGAQSFMTRFFDISESTAGVAKVKRYAFDTAAGMAYPFDIQVQPGTTHNFKGTSTVNSVATATYGAGAYSQVDFGSANIDAPSSDPNGHVYMDRKGYVLIDYKLPAGWTTGC